MVIRSSKQEQPELLTASGTLMLLLTKLVLVQPAAMIAVGTDQVPLITVV